MFKRRKGKAIDARMAVAKALSLVRHTLIRVKLQERRLEYTARRDPIARRMLASLYEVEHLLEFASLRLETLAITGIIPLSELDLPLNLIRKVEEHLGGSPPDVLALLSQAEELLKGTLSSNVSEINELLLSNESPRDNIEDIIKEAKVVAERRLEKLIEGA
jgi:division protein CdvB (Snf7/Vps24/ESCRT-III family)